MVAPTLGASPPQPWPGVMRDLVFWTFLLLGIGIFLSVVVGQLIRELTP